MAQDVHLGKTHNICNYKKWVIGLFQGSNLQKFVLQGKLQPNSERNRKYRKTFQLYKIDEQFRQTAWPKSMPRNQLMLSELVCGAICLFFEVQKYWKTRKRWVIAKTRQNNTNRKPIAGYINRWHLICFVTPCRRQNYFRSHLASVKIAYNAQAVSDKRETFRNS